MIAPTTNTAKSDAVKRYAEQVQAAQKEFLDYMEEQWKLVQKGELSYEEYYKMGWSGEPYLKCQAKVKMATAAYDATL